MARFCRRCDREFTDVVRSCPEHGRELVHFRDARMRPGDVVDGRFVVLNRIGAGASGDVYRARRVGRDRVVALKLFRGRGERRRFENELRVLSRVQSPHIVPVRDDGVTEDGRPYMVMPLIPGRTLRQIIDADAPLGPVRAARLMGQVARGMEALHAAGVAHLDLKPTNIIVTPDIVRREHVTLVDFGIALDRQDEQSASARVPGAGTPGYLSPEQASGEEVDERSDLWSLGVVLHEMLTGARIYLFDDARAAMDRVRLEPPRPIRESHPTLRVPAELDALVLDLLRDDPAERPSAARIREVLDVVAGVAPGQHALSLTEVDALAGVLPRGAPPPVAWHRRAWGVVSGWIGGVVGAAAVVLTPAQRAVPQPLQEAPEPPVAPTHVARTRAALG